MAILRQDVEGLEEQVMTLTPKGYLARGYGD